MTEPKRISSRESLTPFMQVQVHLLFDRMQKRGHDPMLFETLRVPERQDWLYGIGRTHHLTLNGKRRRPVTWTHHSEHFAVSEDDPHAEAFDVISRSCGWDDPVFFKALGQEARKLGLYQIPQEQCHIQRRKP